MRLINADAVLQELDKYINPAVNVYYTGFLDGISTAISEIEDEVSSSTGQWEFKCEGLYNRTKAYCTACGKSSGVGGIRSNQMKPFCPNCGAKMDIK